MTATTTAARCVGESARQTWNGRRSTGRCQRAAVAAVMSYGRHGGHTAPELSCQAHLGGLVARRLAEPRRTPAPPGVTVLTVDVSGQCVRCHQRPDWHEPGAACPATL